MAKSRYITPDVATHRNFIPMSKLSRAQEYVRDGDYLYYGKPFYNNPEYGTGVMLLAFRIRKETNCFYMLECGMRVNREFDGKSFALDPMGAIRSSITRTHNYYEIARKRLYEVQNFLKETDYMRSSRNRGIREMRIFEAIAQQFPDVDDMPIELTKDFVLNPDMTLGELLR